MIRQRVPADLDNCVRALQAVHDADGYPVNWPADPGRWLNPPGTLAAWVFADPQIGGHVLVSSASEPAPAGAASSAGEPMAGEVGRLFVAPSHRGRGIGLGLLTRVREWAVARRLGLVLEVVDDSRGAAIALYERTGWTYTGTSAADWTGPVGEPVRVRHYSLPLPG